MEQPLTVLQPDLDIIPDSFLDHLPDPILTVGCEASDQEKDRKKQTMEGLHRKTKTVFFL